MTTPSHQTVKVGTVIEAESATLTVAASFPQGKVSEPWQSRLRRFLKEQGITVAWVIERIIDVLGGLFKRLRLARET